MHAKDEHHMTIKIKLCYSNYEVCFTIQTKTMFV
jgi:hypothetical protein